MVSRRSPCETSSAVFRHLSPTSRRPLVAGRSSREKSGAVAAFCPTNTKRRMAACVAKILGGSSVGLRSVPAAHAAVGRGFHDGAAVTPASVAPPALSSPSPAPPPLAPPPASVAPAAVSSASIATAAVAPTSVTPPAVEPGVRRDLHDDVVPLSAVLDRLDD